MAGNIIPAIATTNAIVAGLCVLQARHILAHDLDKAKMVFLSKRADQAFVTEPLRPPNPYCQVCGIVRAELCIAPGTTLERVVRDLRDRLGYGEEFSLLGEGGRLLYDVDFDDLLHRWCVEVGVVEGRTLTVVDEDDETNRVNLEFLVSEGIDYQFPAVQDIPQRPPKKKEPKKEVVENGGVLGKRGRDDDGDVEFRKRARVAVENDGEHEIFIIEDDDDIIMLD
jgi:ubiquitin-like 1-activating enzyme E1 B